MRALILLPFLLVCSCTGPIGESPSKSLARATDTEVIAAALSYFRISGDASFRNVKADKAVLFVNSHYERDGRFISKDSLTDNLGLGDGPSWQVPEDARKDMEGRTTGKELVPHAGLPSFVRVRSFEFLQSQVPLGTRPDMEDRTTMEVPIAHWGLPAFARVRNFGLPQSPSGGLYSEYPDALSFVRLYPPGYTRDGKHAVVVFSFPQCDAIYLLALRDGRWNVVRHHIACFPT